MEWKPVQNMGGRASGSQLRILNQSSTELLAAIARFLARFRYNSTLEQGGSSMLWFIVIPCAVLVLFLLFTRNATAAPFDLIAVTGAECEHLYKGLSSFFLRELEAPILRTRSRISLIDRSAIQPLSKDSLPAVLTADELAAISPYLSSAWEGWRICVFRNCAHADRLRNQAEFHRVSAAYWRIRSPEQNIWRPPDDGTLPPIF
jgi:hypothetical protein